MSADPDPRLAQRDPDLMQIAKELRLMLAQSTWVDDETDLIYLAVRDGYLLGVAAGVESERERCAQIVMYEHGTEAERKKVAAAIRAAASEAPPQRSSK